MENNNNGPVEIRGYAIEESKPPLRKSRVWTKIAICFVIAGVVLYAAGWMLGGGRGHVFLNLDGLHVISAENKNDARTVTEGNIPAFNSVKADTTSAKIEVIPSDRYGINIDLPSVAKPEWKIENGQLIIHTNESSNSGLHIFNFGFSTSYGGSIVQIYYPEDAALSLIDLKSVSGSLHVKSDARQEKDAAELILKSTSGSVNAEGRAWKSVTAKSVSGAVRVSGDIYGAAQLSSTSGSVHLDAGFIGKDLTMDSVSGGLRFSGEPRGDIHLKSTSGSIRAEITGKINDFNYNVSSTSGSIRINGERVGKSARAGLSGNELTAHAGSGGNELTAKTTSGGITIDFK